jgi:hypothetical protein
LILERDVEKHLLKGVKKLGGRCIKLVPQFEEGLPDRMVLLPGKIVFFVELKKPGGVRSPAQKIQHKLLARLGHHVYVPDTKAEVDIILKGESDGV